MKKLTKTMRDCLLASEDTLYGDAKLPIGHGNTMNALKRRGYVEGEKPHFYLTGEGKSALSALTTKEED